MGILSKVVNYGWMGIFNVTFFSLCMLGLFYQVFILSSDFFAFNVKIGINIYVPDILPPVATTVCGEIYDILDYETMEQDPNIKSWKYIEQPDIVDLKDIQANASLVDDNLSVKQIMDLTPKEDEVVIGLRFHTNESYVFHETDSLQEINQLLRVIKYIYLEFVCYTISFKDYTNKALRVHTLAGSPVSAGFVYEITLNNQIKRTTKTKILVHHSSLKPYRPLKNSGTIEKSVKTRYINDDEDEEDTWVRYNYFIGSRVYYLYELLERPYQTNCFNYDSKSLYGNEIHCSEECLLERVAQLIPGYLPFTPLIFNDTTEKHRLSYNNLSDPRIREILKNEEDFCRNVKCNLVSCDKMISLTGVGSYQSQGNFTVAIHFPQNPFTTVTATPWMSVAEYLTNCFSIVGVWVGLSVFGLDPTKIVGGIKEKLAQHNKRTGSAMEDHSLERSSRKKTGINKVLSENKLVSIMNRMNRMQIRLENLKYYVQRKQLTLS